MKSSQIEKESKRKAFPEIKLRGVYSVIKTMASQAIIYRNNVKYSGDMNLHITMYFRPNRIKPNIRIIQKEKEKAVLITIGLPKTFETIPETNIILYVTREIIKILFNTG